MNPIIAEVLAKNGPDIEAIVAKIGVPTLVELAPHLMNIAATIQEAQKAEPKPSG